MIRKIFWNVPGFEPETLASKTSTLPLHYHCVSSFIDQIFEAVIETNKPQTHANLDEHSLDNKVLDIINTCQHFVSVCINLFMVKCKKIVDYVEQWIEKGPSDLAS
jgi:hypothetical protein